MSAPIALTIARARGRAAQQAVAARWLDRQGALRCAVVAEGAFSPLELPAGVASVALGIGCACCVGFLPLDVALTRVLRAQRPQAILLLVGDDGHAERLAQRLRRRGLDVSIDARVVAPSAASAA